MCKTKPIYSRAPGNGRTAGTDRSRRGVIVQNEANFSIADCGPRSEPGVTRLWIADWAQTCGGTPDLRPATSSLCRPIVPNEPNSPRTGRERHRQGQNPWRCHPAGELLRQTNPIWRCALGDKDRMCETNPISAVARGAGIPSASLSGQALPVSRDHRQDADATVPPGGGTANLSETRRQLRQTNPISRRGPVGRGLGKTDVGVVPTNPIPALTPIRRSAFPGGKTAPNKANWPREVSGEDAQPTKSQGAIMQNEANFRRSLKFAVSSVKQDRRVKYAKQSQFPPVRRSERPGICHCMPVASRSAGWGRNTVADFGGKGRLRTGCGEQIP
jgi:hypothetical protein